MKWAKILGFVAVCGLILSRSYDLLFNPTIFMDEGYYLGATKAILNGDWLLRHYSFDKPFLMAYAQLPGILLFGENPLGFRLMSIIAYFGGAYFFLQALEKLRPNFIRNLLMTLITFSLPLMHEYGFAIFCEPYLILAFSWLLKELVSGGSVKRVAHALALGVFTKYNFLLWAPMVFLPKKSNRERWILAKKILKEWKYWIIFCLLFLFTNATKFGSVLYLFNFVKLNVGDRSDTSFFQKSGYYLSVLFHQFPALVSLGMLALFGLGAWRAFRRKNVEWRMLWIPAAFHLIVIMIIGAAFIDRYLVVWLPFFFVGVTIGCAELEQLLKAHAKNVRRGVLGFLVIAGAFSITDDRDNIGGPPELGRMLYVLRSELNRPQVMIHPEPLWETIPFRDRAFVNGCMSASCVQEERLGASVQAHHFLIKDREIWRAPLSFSSSCFVRAPLPPIDLQETGMKLLAGLRLGKSFQLFNATENADDSTARSPEGYRPFIEGPSVTFEAIPKRKIPFLGEFSRLIIEGRFAVSDLHDVGIVSPHPRYTLIFVVNKVVLSGMELTDLIMPLFFKGYAVKVKTLPLDWKENQPLHLRGNQFFIEKSQNCNSK